MSLSRNIREQLLKSFRAELSEHLQTMTDGLLALEQGHADNTTLETAFRAAHSLKGAARAMGVTAIEQIAHSLENLLDGLRRRTLTPAAELFTACYHALDAIQLVQSSYEAGETTPPIQALLVLAEMETARQVQAASTEAKDLPTTAERQPDPSGTVTKVDPHQISAPLLQLDVKETHSANNPPAKKLAAVDQPLTQAEMVGVTNGTTVSAGDETVRVDVQKLDSLMASLSELMIARIRLEQRETQIGQLQEMLNNHQKSWSPIQGSYNRLLREQLDGVLSLHRPLSVDISPQQDRNGKPDRSGFRNGLSYEVGGIGGNNASEIKHWMEVSKDAAQLLLYTGANQERLRTMSVMVTEMSRQYSADIMHLSQVIDDLENEIKRMRLLPFDSITGIFARMVRDLATQSGKEAALTVLGGNTEVDKRILEGIKDPLVHLLRNAVDHGIESPETRQAMGKARTGQIVLSARQYGQNVIIRVSDDGAGLKMDAIRQAVENQNARNGIPTGSTPSDVDLLAAIFNMGISTSRIITDVSGRGVGLNVVHNNIELLHGHVEVESRPGEGTTFTLTLPLALTAARCLMVSCARQIFAIPLNTVERILYIQPAEIFILEGQDTIQYDYHPVPLVRLSDVLELSETHETSLSEKKHHPAVVLTSDERRQTQQITFLVDDLVGEQEVVIKSLGNQLTRVAGFAGATVLGSGEVVLILNAADLMKLAARPNRRPFVNTLTSQPMPQEKTSRKCVLVVDDSITTRTLEKNILEAAGYKVILAKDGSEALEIIHSIEQPDLVVTDIVMPRMNGFDLTRQIKEDSQTKELPVILVTSLNSQEDKEHGIEVQADAYIVKNNFDQMNLLEIIEQLI